MIAHKKQFKIAGAIWLVIVMIICQIVPAFASPSTDESGNWLPSNFTATWYIYNTDTQSYSFVNVTSSVTRDGLVFSFPYNSYGVTALRMYLYLPSTSYFVSNLSFEGFVFYDTYGRGSYFTPFSSSSLVYLSNSEHAIVASSYFSGNPFASSLLVNNLGSYFVFEFHPSEVSGNFTVTFSSLFLNDSDISSSVTVQNLDNAGDDLSNLAEDLSVPTPDTDAIFNGMDDAINHVNDSNYQSTYSFFKNDTGIMATYITIVLAMATLGYIFFGKRSA